jgi:hypothetical protein
MLKSWKFEAANYMEICQKNLLTCLSQNFKTCKINILNEKKKFNHYYSIYISKQNYNQYKPKGHEH